MPARGFAPPAEQPAAPSRQACATVRSAAGSPGACASTLIERISEPTTTAPNANTPAALTHLEWSNARVSDRPAAEEIPELKGQPARDIVVFGGVRFARSLAAGGLIDEHRINVQPVALGDGLPLLYGLPEPLRLELVSSTAWADGPITQTYVPR